jgi:hypothetical protein
MKNTIKLKLLPLLLVSNILFICPPLIASNTVSMSEHQKIITRYIEDIKTLQNQVFSLFENAVSVPSQDSPALDSKVNFIYSQLESLDKNITVYLENAPRLSTRRRDTLITLDALHFLENSLYQLIQLINEADPVKRTQLLEDFYFLRTSTTQTLNRLENIISRP